MIVENILKQSGDFGPAQWCLLSLFSIVNVFSAFHYFAQTFISLSPKPCDCGFNITELSDCGFQGDYWNFQTLITEVMSQNIFQILATTSQITALCWLLLSFKKLERLTLLEKSQTFCRRIQLADLQWINTEFQCSPPKILPAEYGGEMSGLSYNKLNWACQEKWKSAVVQSMYFVGSIIGTFTLGILADSFGRVPMLITANLLGIFGNLMTVYLNPTIWFLSIARFVAGLATDTNFFMMYIIVMEYIKPSLRTFGLNLCIGVWYCIGCMIIPWLAVATGNWRHFLIYISVPALIIPLSCVFVPESAQWLLSIGKTHDAIECFVKLAAFNRKKISEDTIQRFKLVAKNNSSNQRTNLLGLFKTPCLRRKTCILVFKTIVLTLCYDAMARNIERLNLDPFTAFTITSASIFPSCVVVLILQDKIGRKSMAVFSLLFTGLFSFGQAISLTFFKDFAYISAVIGLFGRFFVNIAYNSGTQYAAELIPTQVRGQGLAAMHVVGYGAAFFSPYILYLSNVWIAIPESTFGILSVAGAAFCLFLPETLNKPLPTTLQEGEAFGEDEKMFDFLKKKTSNIS